ncbi:MAG TPA: ArsB/NhaD family transporter [Microlunatus sp.]
MSLTAWLALGVFATAYIVIVTERFSRTAVALLGAAAMVVIGSVRGHDIFFSEDTGIDWNVIFLLFGMMVIVGILRQTGVFEFLAIWSAQRARGRPFRMMVLLVLITAVASAFLDNVTTVLLIAPVTLLLCERLALNPVPFLLAEVMASNIGGTATLIGDPPNIIIGSRADLGFNDFLVHLTPIVVVLMAVFVGLCWLLWGRHLTYDAERAQAVMRLEPRETISDPRMLLRVGVVLFFVLVGFLTHAVTHLEPSLVALLGAGAAILVSRVPHPVYLEEIEWETLLFFAGLFIMVGSLVHQGVIGDLADTLTARIGDDYGPAAFGMLVGSAVLSAIVDNIPYVATMSPVVYDLVGPAPGLEPQQQSLWWALALGADLGGNATAIGASANVVVTGIARRNGHPITFWTFTRYGLVVTTVTIALCVPYIGLRYFVLA